MKGYLIVKADAFAAVRGSLWKFIGINFHKPPTASLEIPGRISTNTLILRKESTAFTIAPLPVPPFKKKKESIGLDFRCLNDTPAGLGF